MNRPRLNPFAQNLRPYSTRPHEAPIELRLSGNEGAAPSPFIWEVLGKSNADVARRYPSESELQSELAARTGVSSERIVVTAGGDDAIDRICRMTLGPGRELVLPTPTFEMIARYATLCGATVREVDWSGSAFPTDAVLAEIGPKTGLIALVSPNNPTGAVASVDDLNRLASAAPGAVVLVDQAYAEFSDDDLTQAALDLDNAVVVRTLSKAWGLAGLRVGYAIAPMEIAQTLRAVGQPYAVAAPSIALARAALREPRLMRDYVRRVRAERESLGGVLRELKLEPRSSQGNFILTRPPDPSWLHDGLAGQGVGIRTWPDDPKLASCARITCPGDEADCSRLVAALRTTIEPEVILFDMDGVLVDVSASYRTAIQQTAASFGVAVTDHDIANAKNAGNANDDWALTHRLLRTRGTSVSLTEVTQRFESLYQGTEERAGLYQRESLLFDRQDLIALGKRIPLGIVTGRPRADAQQALEQFAIQDLFDVVICREDGPLKPDPTPVRRALEQLGVSRGWMIGDTVDDIRAARAAGLLALGFQSSANEDSARVLRQAGAGRILRDLSRLGDMLP